MLFSSLEFLFLFLPITLILYYLCPLRWRNVVLFAVSLVFYGWGEPLYVFLMIGTIAVDYVFGYFVAKYRTCPAGRRWLFAAVAVNLAILAFFKYTGFVLDNLRLLPGLGGLPAFSVKLPIGISFYTFQALSYVVDVYRGDAVASRNPLIFGTYVTLFPQLIAGPIVRYNDVAEQLDVENRRAAMNRTEIASGVRTFLVGLGKKVLLANTAGELWEHFRAIPCAENTVTGAWLGVFFFSLHIYFDFSGYSDMAIGLGRMLGFRFCENFYYPYMARSVTDFWRRWHISLSTWFREYVYIPLGGNRVGRGRLVFNLFVTWFLTGLWHGARWNYVIWGLYFFLLLTGEKLLWGKWLEKLPRALQHVYALFFILVGWLIFAFEDSAEGLSYLSVMLGVRGAGVFSRADAYELFRNAFFVIICLYGCTPHARDLATKLTLRRPRLFGVLSTVAGMAVLLLCTAYLVNSSYNPFLYFNF